MKTIAFFGHKQVFNKYSVKEKILSALLDMSPNDFSNFLVGCHGDFDALVLSACLEYKERVNSTVKISIVLTDLSFLNKDDSGKSKVDFYKNLGCETMVFDIENVHHKNRITYSNKKMVDKSDLIICYVDTNAYKSGANTAIKYATKQNKKIINLFKN